MDTAPYHARAATDTTAPGLVRPIPDRTATPGHGAIATETAPRARKRTAVTETTTAPGTRRVPIRTTAGPPVGTDEITRTSLSRTVTSSTDLRQRITTAEKDGETKASVAERPRTMKDAEIEQMTERGLGISARAVEIIPRCRRNISRK